METKGKKYKKQARIFPDLFDINLLKLCFFFFKKLVDDNADDKRSGDGSDLESAEIKHEAADSENENGAYNKEVVFFVKVNGLDHFKTGNGDEAIKRGADSAENAAGNGVDKSYEGAEESKKNGKKSRGSDSYDGSVFGDCNTTYGFAVSGVGAATEECACHGTYAVAEEGFVKTGFSKKIAFDDGRNVFVVSNMFRKNNECNGSIEKSKGSEIRKGHCEVSAGDFFECFNKCKFGHMEEGSERKSAEVVYKCGIIDDFESFNVCKVADYGENGSKNIAGKNADDKGDKFCKTFAFGGNPDGYAEGEKSADNCRKAIGCAGGGSFGKVADCVSCKGKSDKSNGGSDYNGGHKFVEPAGTDGFNKKCDYYVNKTCKDCTENDSEETENGCGIHGRKEGKGASEENGAFLFGEELINKGADACAEKCCGGVHFKVDCAIGVNKDRDYDGCGDNCKKLLECEDDKLAEFRLVFNVKEQFFLHDTPPRCFNNSDNELIS